MIHVEVWKLLSRLRTWITIALLAGLPVVIGIFLAATDVAPRPGEGPALLSEVLNNGLLFPAAALAVILPIFLPVATAVIAGDAFAGEAAYGTLRYLLIRPVSRNRLLVAKVVALAVFVLIAVVAVVGVGYVAGALLFGTTQPLTSVSGTAVTYTGSYGRTALTMAFIATSMMGLGSIALYASTRAETSLSAALTALAAFVVSQVLDLIDATHAIQPYLPTHYWLSFLDIFREPILWHDITRGFAIQAAYMFVFLLAAWANLATKDVTN
jgi:ABC-2 type transport system permease protein